MAAPRERERASEFERKKSRVYDDALFNIHVCSSLDLMTVIILAERT